MLSLYLAVLDDQSKEEQFIDVYNIYKRLVYHKLCFIHIVIVLCSDLRKICYTKWQLLRDDTTHRLLMFHT